MLPVTALEKVKCHKKFPVERLVRSDALNTRQAHTGPGKHTLDDGRWDSCQAQPGSCLCSLRKREVALPCPVPSSPWHSSPSAIHLWNTTNSSLWQIWYAFPMWLMLLDQEIVWFRVLHGKPEGEGKWRCCRWHSGPSWLAVVAVQLSWARERSCAGAWYPESQACPTCLRKGISSPMQARQRRLLLQQDDGASHCSPQWFYFSSFYIPNHVQNYTVERTKKHFQVQAERIINISLTLHRRI